MHGSQNNLRIVLFQPDIPGNTGTILRTAACLGCTVDVIEPAGFRLDDRALQRAGMDYLDRAALFRHESWDAFETWRKSEGRRLVLATTLGAEAYAAHAFQADDCLIFGRESSGAPEHVHDAADARLLIPMAAEGRSLNLAVSVGMIAGEALRQTIGMEI